MPKYIISKNGIDYEIESAKELLNSDFEHLADNILSEVQKQEIQEKPELKGQKPQGSFVKSMQKGLTFGTAPLMAGYGESVGTSLYNILHGKPLLEDTGKALKRGSEEFKAGQAEYEKEKPIAAIAGEILGGLPLASVGGAGLKGLSALGKIAKGAKIGAGFGGAYGLGEGLANTPEKAIDIKKGLEGLGTGTIAGAAFGTAGSAIPEGIKKLFKTGIKGNVTSYIRPKGTQVKTIKNIIKSPEIQKEALRGDLGMRYSEIAEDTANDILKLKGDLKNIVTKEYAKIPKDTTINLTNNNTLGKMNDAILEFEGKSRFNPRPQELEKAKTMINVLSKESSDKIKLNIPAKIAEPNKSILYKDMPLDLSKSRRELEEDFVKKIPFESLKDLTSELNALKQKAYKDGDTALYNMYGKMRDALTEARDTDPAVQKATKMYSTFSNALDELETGLGVKLDNPKNIVSRLFTTSRDASGEYAANRLDEMTELLSKYPQTKHFSKINDKIKLAQIAYDLRPPEESKLLSQIKENPMRVLGLLAKPFEEPAAQTRAKQISKRLLEGTIKPEDLQTFELSKGGDFLNKFIQRQKTYGGTIPSMANAVKKLQLSRYTLPKLTIMDLLKNREENK